MQPLAMVYYERLMPGSQLVNRLQDANYRVMTLNKADALAKSVQREMPMILFAELTKGKEIMAAIEAVKADPATTHIPIIAYAPDKSTGQLESAQKAGANLTVSDSALLSHLPQWIEQALHID